MSYSERVKNVVGISVKPLSRQEKIDMSGGETRGIIITNQSRSRDQGALFDARMGPMYPSCNKRSCAGSNCIHTISKDRSCIGRFGRIELPMPFISPMHYKIAVMVISCICPYCGRIKITRQTMDREGVFKLQGFQRLKKISELCNGSSDNPIICENRQITKGQNCSSEYPRIFLKEIPDLVESRDSVNRKIKRIADLESRASSNPKYSLNVNRSSEIGVVYYYIISDELPKDERPLESNKDLPLKTAPHVAKNITGLSGREITRYDYGLGLNDCLIILRIANKYAETLGFTEGSKPEDLVTDIVLVTPPIARQEHIDLGDNKFYSNIISKSNALSAAMKKQPEDERWVSPWSSEYDPVNRQSQEMTMSIGIQYLDLLKAIMAMTITDNTTVTNNYGGEGSSKSVMDQIKGKKGTMRQSITRPLDFCSRTVAGAHMEDIDTVFIPTGIAANMTTKESITRYNIVHMNSKCSEGMVARIRLSGGKSINVGKQKSKKERMLQGMMVDRHLEPGDKACMWRSPTISTEGVRCFNVSFDPNIVRKSLGYDKERRNISDLTYGTSRFNLAVAHAPNMDFDGDEIGMKYLQEPKHIIPAIVYGMPQRSVKSKSKAINALGVISQFCYVAHMLTGDDNFVPIEFINDFIISMSDIAKIGLETLSRRLEFHKISPFSGKGVFSIILPEKMNYNGSIVIRNGILIKGRVGDSEIGYNTTTIIDHVAHEYGEPRGYYLVQDLYTLLKKYSHIHGLSLSIVDMVPMDDIIGEEISSDKDQSKGRLIPKMDIEKLNKLLREGEIKDTSKYESEMRKIAVAITLDSSKELAAVSEIKNNIAKMFKMDGKDPNAFQKVYELIDDSHLNSKLMMNPRRSGHYKKVLHEANVAISKIPDMKSQLEIETYKLAIANGVLGQAQMGNVKKNLSVNMSNIMDSGCSGSIQMVTKLTVGLGATTSQGKIMDEYLGKRYNAYEVLTKKNIKPNNIIDKANFQKVGEYPQHFKDLGISENSLFDGLSMQQTILEAARARTNEVRGKIGENDYGVGATCRLHRTLNSCFGSVFAQYDNTSREDGKIYTFAIHTDGYETKKMKRVDNYDVPFNIKSMVGSIIDEILLKEVGTEFENLERKLLNIEIEGERDEDIENVDFLRRRIEETRVSDSVLDALYEEYSVAQNRLGSLQSMKPESISYFTDLKAARSEVVRIEKEIEAKKLNIYRMKKIYSSNLSKSEKAKVNNFEMTKATIIANHKGKTSAYLSKEETVKILVRRTIEIENGSPALFFIPENKREIAIEELRREKETSKNLDIEAMIKLRIKEISKGSIPKIEMMSSHKIAVEEMKRGLLQFEITRKLPDGSEEHYDQSNLVPFEFF